MPTRDDLANASLPKNKQIKTETESSTSPVASENQEVQNTNHVEETTQVQETNQVENTTQSINEEQSFEDQPSQDQTEAETEDSTSSEEEEVDFSWLDNNDDESSNEEEEEWSPEAMEEEQSIPEAQEETTSTPSTEQPSIPAYNYEDLSNVLGSQVNSIEDVQRIVSELKQQKENGSFANSLIKEANEIASQGGDYLGYLQGSTVDYSQVSDDDILMNTFRNQYGDRYSQEQLEDHIDTMTSMEKSLQADNIRRNLQYNENQRIAQIKSKTEFDRKQKHNSLFNELRSTETIAGRKIDNKEKTKLFNEVKDEKAFIKKMFYDKNGKFDAKKAVYHAYMVDNHKDIIKSTLNRGRNDATADFMQEAGNVTINRRTAQAPSNNKNTKGMSTHEKILNHNGPIKRIKIKR